MKEYLSIQYLRGLAALFVVLYHLGEPLTRMGWLDGRQGRWPLGLSAGVDIFFVISGFVMWLTTRARPVGPVAFWRRRIVRIVPLYWLVTTLMLALLLTVPSAFRTSVFDLRHVVGSYLFVPMRNPGKAEMEPLVFAGWTLNYEMFFYVLFGLLLPVRPMLRLAATAGVLVVLVAGGRLIEPPRLSLGGFYTSSIMLEFAYGMVIAECVHRRPGRLFGRLIGWLLVVAGLLVMLLPPEFKPVPWGLRYGLPAAVIVAGAVTIERDGGLPEWRWLRLLGDASYSIYLTQLISMAAFAAAWSRLGLGARAFAVPVFILLDVAVALAAGWLCYRAVERPLLAWFSGNRTRVARENADGPRTRGR